MAKSVSDYLLFVVQRFVNQTDTADGPQLPPRAIGNVRVPPPKGFRLLRATTTVTQTIFTLQWQCIHPTEIANVDHYTIYASGFNSLSPEPVQVGQSSVSPCQIGLNPDVHTTVTFYIQTVLKSGLHSDLAASPTVTATAAPAS